MTALVMAVQDIDLEVEPDTGVQGELAKAEDELNAADQALKDEENAFRRAAKAKVKAEQAAKTFEQILNGNSKESKEDIKPE